MPEVDGVGFLDINHVERGALFVFLVEAIELGNLPAKRRSTVAAEDQYDRPALVLFCNSDAACVVNRG